MWSAFIVPYSTPAPPIMEGVSHCRCSYYITVCYFRGAAGWLAGWLAVPRHWRMLNSPPMEAPCLLQESLGIVCRAGQLYVEEVYSALRCGR